MVSELERNAALAELLIARVEGEAARSHGSPRPERERRSSWTTERLRVAVVTGVVAAMVVGGSAYVIWSQASAPSRPAAIGSPTRISSPAPGRTLATFRSQDGRTQTRTVAVDGSALQILLDCSGSGTITVMVPGGPSIENQRCNGSTTIASPAQVQGSVPVAVTARGDSTWTVSIETIATHGRGVIFPG